MRAYEIMTSEPLTIEETATAEQAGRLLHDMDIRHLPVTRGNQIVGMLSDRDLHGIYMPEIDDEAALTQANQLYDTPISRLMNTALIQVDSETSVPEIVQILVENRIGAVPVTEPTTGDLLGIVSYVDVLQALANQLKD